MNLIGQFLLYNLLPSIFIGLLAWIVVFFALKVLPIHDPKLRLSFLGVPVIKSALVFLGLGSFLPWAQSLSDTWQANALTLAQLLPALLIWTGILFLGYLVFVGRARRNLIKHAFINEELISRLEQSLRRVRHRYHQNPIPRCDIPFCAFASRAPAPQLLVSEQLRSPTALSEGGQPTIIFPAGLVDGLTEEELDGVMAHELGHFVLRRNRWCSTTLLRRLILISPAAAIVSARLNSEEEMACDDIAVGVVGNPDVYARTLLKSYRFARNQSTTVDRMARPLPQLLGVKAQLATRIERLVNDLPPERESHYQYVLACLLWFGLVLLFFSGA